MHSEQCLLDYFCFSRIVWEHVFVCTHNTHKAEDKSIANICVWQSGHLLFYVLVAPEPQPSSSESMTWFSKRLHQLCGRLHIVVMDIELNTNVQLDVKQNTKGFSAERLRLLTFFLSLQLILNRNTEVTLSHDLCFCSCKTDCASCYSTSSEQARLNNLHMTTYGFCVRPFQKS